ncbi:MAG: hypothetical protein AAF663_04395 [Planctomycetota bacterium]
MRINDRNGKVEIALTKSETARLLEAAYLATRISRNEGDVKVAEEAASLAALCRSTTTRYGAQYLDDDGNLVESGRNKRDASEAPASGY